jgi:hypothetical protein
MEITHHEELAARAKEVFDEAIAFEQVIAAGSNHFLDGYREQEEAGLFICAFPIVAFAPYDHVERVAKEVGLADTPSGAFLRDLISYVESLHRDCGTEWPIFLDVTTLRFIVYLSVEEDTDVRCTELYMATVAGPEDDEIGDDE